jgi:hypothetical protein
MLDLFDQVAQTVRRIDRLAALVVCRREAIDADLHSSVRTGKTAATGMPLIRMSWAGLQMPSLRQLPKRRRRERRSLSLGQPQRVKRA